MPRGDAGVGAASGCPLLPPRPACTHKAGAGGLETHSWKDTQNDPAGGAWGTSTSRGRISCTPTRRAAHACAHMCPRGGWGGCAQAGRAARAGRAPRPQFCHTLVYLPTLPEWLSSPAASGERPKPGSMGTREIAHHFLPPVRLCTV